MDLKELIKEVENLKWQEKEGVKMGSYKSTAHNCLWGIKQTVEADNLLEKKLKEFYEGNISHSQFISFYLLWLEDRQKLKELLEVN